MGTAGMTISSPQPSVLHLVTLFRQIGGGEIRIPAFQRGFVWNEKQMTELLDSVLEGFPIGSILLWNVDHRILKIAPPEATSFPAMEESFPANYVLDGMQRLATLYGVFHFGTSTKDPRFDVVYDLKTATFFHRASLPAELDTMVPLSALFTPRQLLEHQARLAALEDADALIDRLLAIQTAFQEYMIPVVTIRSTDVRRIVEIFERVNSTGTRLDPVDFMRAITWAEDFDLNHHLEEAAATIGEIGFSLGPETIIKCVGLVLGLPPTAEGLLQLRQSASSDMRRAFQTAKECLGRVARFADSRFAIKSSSFIPYEGQLLLLFKTVGLQEAHQGELDAIVRWFWAVGFNESLRGKPDHYVFRAVDNWRGLIRGTIRGLEPRLKLTPLEIAERRLVSGGALSSTFAAMHAVGGARGLSDGEIIPPAA
jgi:hypothetical protein